MGSIHEYDHFFIDEQTCSPEVLDKLHSTCQPTVDEIQQQQICVDVTTRKRAKSTFEVTQESMTLGRKLGEGTYGAVYELKHNLNYIVKQFKQFIDQDGIVDLTTLNELSALRAFNNTKGFLHMNQLYFKEIHDVNRDTPFQIIPEVIMPKYQLNLKEYQERFFPSLSKEEKLDTITHIAFKLLTTYSQMIRKKILHLDIKPENILLNMIDGKIDIDSMVMADFGLSFYEGSSVIRNRYRYTDYQVQTITYRAPEVHFGNMYAFSRRTSNLDKDTYITYKADLFSIGKILYDLYYDGQPSDTQMLFPLYELMKQEELNNIKHYMLLLKLMGVPELWKNDEMREGLQEHYHHSEEERSNETINRLKDDRYRLFKTSMAMLKLINMISDEPIDYNFSDGNMFFSKEYHSNKEALLHDLIVRLMKLCPYERIDIVGALQHPLFIEQGEFIDGRLNAIFQYIHTIPTNEFEFLFSRMNIPALHTNLCMEIKDSPNREKSERYMRLLFDWMCDVDNRLVNRHMVIYLTTYRSFFTKEYNTYEDMVNSSSKLQTDAIGLYVLLANTYEYPITEYEFIGYITAGSIDPTESRKLYAHLLSILDSNLYFVTPYDIWNLYDLTLYDTMLCEYLYIMTMCMVSFTVNTFDVQALSHIIAHIVLKENESSDVAYTEQEQELFVIWEKIARSFNDLPKIINKIVIPNTRLYNHEVVMSSPPIDNTEMAKHIIRLLNTNKIPSPPKVKVSPKTNKTRRSHERSNKTRRSSGRSGSSSRRSSHRSHGRSNKTRKSSKSSVSNTTQLMDKIGSIKNVSESSST